MIKLLAEYNESRQKIFDYFGYVEDWKIIPLGDSTNYYWQLIGTKECGSVRFASSKEDINGDDANYYEYEIYTQRFLPKWIYRAKDYTMICVDTQTDGNKLLQIFDNNKEIK